MMHILAWLLFCLALSTEAKPTCRPRDVAQVRKVISTPKRFCTWYGAVRRNRSPFADLSAARLRDACHCIAPPPLNSKPQRRIKGYNSRKSCRSLYQIVSSYTKQPQNFCAFWLAAPPSDRSRFTTPIKSLAHPMDVYKACKCGGPVETTQRSAASSVTTRTTRSMQSRSITSRSEKPRTTTARSTLSAHTSSPAISTRSGAALSTQDSSGQGTSVPQSTSTTISSPSESTSTDTSTTTSVQSSSTTTASSSASTTASVQSSSTTTASPSAVTRLWVERTNAQPWYVRELQGAVAMPGLGVQSQASTFHLDEDGYLISDTRHSQFSVGLQSEGDNLGQLINADAWDNSGGIRCPLKCSFETNGEVPCTAICPDSNQTLDTFSRYRAVNSNIWIRFGSSTADTGNYPTFKMMWDSYLPDPPQAPAPDPPAKMSAQQLSAAYTLLATGNTMFDDGQQWMVSSGSEPNSLSIATTSPDLFSLASASNPDFTVDINQTSPNTLRITEDPNGGVISGMIGYGSAEAVDPNTQFSRTPVKCTYYVDYSVKCIVVGSGGRIYQYPFVVPASQGPYAFGLSSVPLLPETEGKTWWASDQTPFVLSLGPGPCTFGCG